MRREIKGDRVIYEGLLDLALVNEATIGTLDSEGKYDVLPAHEERPGASELSGDGLLTFLKDNIEDLAGAYGVIIRRATEASPEEAK